jgi:hypothetical protein
MEEGYGIRMTVVANYDRSDAEDGLKFEKYLLINLK